MQKKILILILKPDRLALENVLDKVKKKGLVPVLFAPSYDNPLDELTSDYIVKQPMDYIDASSIDKIYRATFDWQKGLPSVALSSGETLDMWGLKEGVSAVWSWIGTVYPHVHLRIRFIESISIIMNAEKPISWTLIGNDDVFPWQNALVRRIMEQVFSEVQEVFIKPLKKSRSRNLTFRPFKRIIGGSDRSIKSLLERFKTFLVISRLGMRKVYSRGLGVLNVSVKGRINVVSTDNYELQLNHHSKTVIMRAVFKQSEKGSGTTKLTVENGQARAIILVNSETIQVPGSDPVMITGMKGECHVKLIGRKAKITLNREVVIRTRKLPVTKNKRISLEHTRNVGRAKVQVALVVSPLSVFRWVKFLLSPFLSKYVGPLKRVLSRNSMVKKRTRIEETGHAALMKKKKQGWANIQKSLDEWASTLPASDKPTLALIMRGRRGSHWYYSPKLGWMLWDLYIEAIPEAMIEMCRKYGKRLIIIHEGQAPEYDDKRLSYSDRFPDIVHELVTGDLKGLFNIDRIDHTTSYEPKFQQLLSSEEFKAAFSYRGVNFFDSIVPVLEAEVINRSALLDLKCRAWSEIFSRFNPEIVFGGRLESRPDINYAAHHCSAKTVTIKLGVGEEMLPSFIACKADKTFDHHAFPDMILVWGEQQKKFLSERLPEYQGKIETSGRTRNDTFINEVHSVDLEKIRSRLGLEEKDRLILYGATARTRYGMVRDQPWGTSCLSSETMEQSLLALKKVLNQVPHTRIIFKPHPADNIILIEELLKKIGDDRIKIITDDDGFHNVELLSVAELFVSSVSSMFSEAAACNCLPVNVWSPDINFLYEFNRNTIYNNIAVPVEGVDVLTETVVRLMQDNDLRARHLTRILEGLTDFFGSLDGKNAHRAVELALSGLNSDQSCK